MRGMLDRQPNKYRQPINSVVDGWWRPQQFYYSFSPMSNYEYIHYYMYFITYSYVYLDNGIQSRSFRARILMTLECHHASFDFSAIINIIVFLLTAIRRWSHITIFKFAFVGKSHWLQQLAEVNTKDTWDLNIIFTKYL